MASKYDKIQTARDLVMEVKFHGLSCKPEDICRAQDIFGHSTIEELDTLANDIGRNNANGEPDPNGTRSSTRVPTRDTFYAILFQIWNWEDATRFWNQHSNPDRDQIAVAQIESKTLRAEVNDKAKRIEQYQQKVDLMEERLAEYDKIATDRLDQINAQSAALREREDEIIRLKARLYDLLTK